MGAVVVDGIPISLKTIARTSSLLNIPVSCILYKYDKVSFRLRLSAAPSIVVIEVAAAKKLSPQVSNIFKSSPFHPGVIFFV